MASIDFSCKQHQNLGGFSSSFTGAAGAFATIHSNGQLKIVVGIAV